MSPSRTSRRLRLLFWGFFLPIFALLTVIVIIASLTFHALWFSLPPLDRSRFASEQSILLLDRRGGELYRIFSSVDRASLPSNQIPLHVKQAIIATEDERLQTRPCVDVRALIRAVTVNLFTDRTEGASTITQQLVRSAFLTHEKTMRRKLQEIMLACKLEQRMSKDEILTTYLNHVSFGGNIAGIEQAAKMYFGVSARELTVAQAATLASIPQRPTTYAPYGAHARTKIPRQLITQLRSGVLRANTLPTGSIQPGLLPLTLITKQGTVTFAGRSNHVLSNMLRLGFISDQDYRTADLELRSLAFRPRGRPLTAPHFVLWSRSQVRSLLDRQEHPEEWIRSGLRVQTTLDPVLQRRAEESIAMLFPKISEESHAHNVALVALDRRTREVLAYVGNTDYGDEEHDGKVDMALVPRQPGSSFKPLVYATLFAKGYGPDSWIEDAPLRLGHVVPKNYEGGFMGWIRIRGALAASRNIPAIRAYFMAGGEDPILDLASRAGAPSPKLLKEDKNNSTPELADPWVTLLQYGEGIEESQSTSSFTYGWPLAIGAVEIPLVEMVQAYATLANRGVFKIARAIKSVTDSSGHVFFRVPIESERRQVIAPEIAEEITGILRDEVARPEGYWRKAMELPGMQAAMKTGTSNVCLRRTPYGTCLAFGVNNTWAMGSTRDFVVGVWVGNADNGLLTPDSDGLNVAVPIWKDFVMAAQAERLMRNY